jgi:hypothetical protein
MDQSSNSRYFYHEDLFENNNPDLQQSLIQTANSTSTSPFISREVNIDGDVELPNQDMNQNTRQKYNFCFYFIFIFSIIICWFLSLSNLIMGINFENIETNNKINCKTNNVNSNNNSDFMTFINDISVKNFMITYGIIGFHKVILFVQFINIKLQKENIKETHEKCLYYPFLFVTICVNIAMFIWIVIGSIIFWGFCYNTNSATIQTVLGTTLIAGIIEYTFALIMFFLKIAF